MAIGCPDCLHRSWKGSAALLPSRKWCNPHRGQCSTTSSQESVAVTVVSAFPPDRKSQNGDWLSHSAIVLVGLCCPTASPANGAHRTEAALLSAKHKGVCCSMLKLLSGQIANLKMAIGCPGCLHCSWKGSATLMPPKQMVHSAPRPMLHDKPQESVAVMVVTAFLPGRQTQNGDWLSRLCSCTGRALPPYSLSNQRCTLP